MESRISLLKNGNVVYYSTKLDLYFVTKIVYYKRKSTSCNRISYFTFGLGKHRKQEQKVIRHKKPEFYAKLSYAKIFDEKKPNIQKTN